jgi:hypothetical protein
MIIVQKVVMVLTDILAMLVIFAEVVVFDFFSLSALV